MRTVGIRFWRLAAFSIAMLLAFTARFFPRQARPAPPPTTPVPITVTTPPGARAPEHFRIHYLFFSATPRHPLVRNDIADSSKTASLRPVSSLQAFDREIDRIDSGINLDHGDATAEIMSPLRKALPDWRIELAFSGSAAVIPGAATSVMVGPRPGDPLHAQVRENVKLSHNADGKWTIRGRGAVYFDAHRGWSWDGYNNLIVLDRTVELGGTGDRSGLQFHCIRWLDNTVD